jgi:hypothetical protein
MEKIKTTHRKQLVKVYRSNSSDCKQCVLRSTCIGKSNFKTIEQTLNKPLYDKMHHRMQTPYAKQLRRIRSSTVEPVIGTLVNFGAIRRVNTKGIDQATKCLLTAAIAYNLKKLMKFKQRRAINVQSPLPKIKTATIKQAKALQDRFQPLIHRIIETKSLRFILNFIQQLEQSYTRNLHYC